MSAPAVERPDERLHRLGHAIGTAAAVAAARRLGILDHLAHAPATAADVAVACDTVPAPTRLLLDALDALGVLRRDREGRYAATDATSWSTALAALWSTLDHVVRDGRPLVAADTPPGAARTYPEAVADLARLFAPAARRAADVLAAGRACAVLDVGAGAAPWSIALARTDPAVRVTALDVPEVLPATRRAVRAAGLTGRFHFQAADVFATEFPPAAYDLILLGNVCHLFDAETNRALLDRLRPALRAGGRLAIVDTLPSDEPEVRGELSLYALGLRARTQAGAVHPLAAYTEWTTEAGCPNLTTTALGGHPPLTLLTATG